jgi:hypothetical protein
MLFEDIKAGGEASELPGLIGATDGWLERLYSTFRDWCLSPEAKGEGDDLWQQILHWYTAFDLSFTQLAQFLEDRTDMEDARLALEEGGESILLNRVRLLPLARQRLRALAPGVQDHLLKVHLSRLVTQGLPTDEEQIAGMEGLFRLRAHGCRIVYHRAAQGPIILAVTPEHWPHPSQ